jgi:biotin operon repressor
MNAAALFSRVKHGSQCERILRVLADGAWHSVNHIHRKAGYSRLNSRVSELRSRGYDIEHMKIHGRSGTKAHRYRWNNAPPLPPAVTSAFEVPYENVCPRDAANRFRCYAVEHGEQRLLGTCADPEALGVMIVTLASEGELNNATLGVLDTLGQDENPGKWLVNPYCGDF